MQSTRTVQVSGPDWRASLVVRNGDVIEADPMLAWTVGKPYKWMRRQLLAKGYSLEDGLGRA